MKIKAKEMTMKERKECVAALVEQFKENEAFYFSKDFVESETKNKFIDPFLACLKWDVKNEKGGRRDKQEVITEDRVLIKGQGKHYPKSDRRLFLERVNWKRKSCPT